MANNEKQIGVRVNAELWRSFRQDVQDRHGGIRGHLKHEVESALREYMDASHGGDVNDRLTRIESELQTIRGTLVEDEEKKERTDVSATVENRLDKIRETIEREADGSPKVHEQVVELAIKQHAGKSDPTLRQYKRLLTEEEDLFEHPKKDNLYYRDPTEFVLATNAMRKGNKISQSTYNDILDEHGEGWWIEQLPANDADDSQRGFQ